MNFNRRDLSAAALVTLAGASQASAAAADGISHNNLAIHKEVMLRASVNQVYQTLTTASLFNRVVQVSAAMNSSMKSKLGAVPTQIDAHPGGAFALFGGYISGFNLELVTDVRLIQAWRSASWKSGEYSIVRFSLEPRGGSTRLVLDHTGFPTEEANSLVEGWEGNYLTPMAKVLT
jgi:activator of HSP90 ATPase